MKKIVLFVLTLIAIVLAGDDKIEDLAKRFKTDVETVQICLDEDGTDIAELNASFQKLTEMKDGDINEEIKQSLIKYNRFVACILEKNDMMVDSKLILDKIFENIEKEMELTPSHKEVLTECLNSVNEDSEMSAREDKAFGLILCVSSIEMKAEGR